MKWWHVCYLQIWRSLVLWVGERVSAGAATSLRLPVGGHLPWGKGKLAQLGGREKVKVKSLSRVRLFAVPWTVAHQAPLSMGLRRHEYWSGLPFPSPGDHPDPGIKPGSPTLQADALPSELPGKCPRTWKVPGREGELGEELEGEGAPLCSPSRVCTSARQVPCTH